MKSHLIILILLSSSLSFGQNKLDRLLKKYNDESIPYISVEELAMPKTNAIILDAREIEEYNISHIKNAIFVGYNTFDVSQLNIKTKQTPIVVYCSLGIRSETIAKKLKAEGYTNVKNLYGGIFEWKNKKQKIYNTKQIETDSVHTFSKSWSKWLTNGIKYSPKQ